MFQLFKKKAIQVEITNLDYAPQLLLDQLPFCIKLIRQIPGKDRPDYWIAKLDKPLLWTSSEISYLIVGARFTGSVIQKGMGRIVLGIALVVDESLLNDASLDFSKCEYVAIGEAVEIQ